MTETTKTPEDRKEKSRGRLSRWVHSSGFICTLLYLGTVAFLCGIFFSVCTPRKYNLRVGSIAHETVRATRDVVDEVATEDRRNAAAAAVEPTYHFQEGVKEEVLSSLDAAFSELRTVQQYGVTLQNESNSRPRMSYTDEEIEYAQSLVQTLSLSKYQITTLLRTTTAAFDEMVSTVTTAVENSLNTTIREGQVSQSIQTIQQIVGYKLDVSLTQNILPTVLRTCIQPNMTIDQEATEEAREKAREAVEPVTYLQGQNIIWEGDRITRNQLELLRSLGLLSDDAYDYSVFQGAVICVLLSMLCLLMLLYLLERELLANIRSLTVILLVVLITVALGAVTHALPSVYLMPVSLGSILVTVLIGYRAGIAVAIPLGMLLSGLSSASNNSTAYDVMLLLTMTLAGSTATIWFLKGHPQRVRVLLAGLISSVAGVAVIYAIKLLTSADSLDLNETILWAIGGNMLSGIIALALQPLFETVFRLPTPSKLLELTNPNQPLMRRLMIEAPGTYHHSIIVANLAEAAAGRIGANPYLARAGAYYHDVGKLKRPTYFKENQTGDNPHDKTDPYVSAAILTSHTRDGFLLGQKERMPVEVLDIILQHHGDTPVMYFYHKALQMSNGSPVDMKEFRYDGPRPQTKEAAIVMLADTIEAAVRSMKDPTPRAIDQFIEQLVRGKLEDGQLSDSPLSLRDIDEICEAFSGILKGVFHERIEYPTVRHSVAGNLKDQRARQKQAAEQAAQKAQVPAPEGTQSKAPEGKPPEKAEPKKETPGDAAGSGADESDAGGGKSA